MQSGLNKIKPDRRDYSLVHTFGALPTDVKGLPENFSVYDGRTIPNQELADARFTPPVDPLPYGCTGETATFDSGIQDNTAYRPDIPYYATTPFRTDTGRDMRVMLGAIKDRELLFKQDGTKGPKRVAYFNCYGSGKIDDFDAARIAIWINQKEKRGVWVGSWWYPDFAIPFADGRLKTPSYETKYASLHAHLVTGWKTMNGEPHLESISWQGMDYGDRGKVYFSREQYNKLMQQPWTGAFTETKLGANDPIPLGYQVIIDHLVYFVRSLFKI